jgi:hypothetical protein
LMSGLVRISSVATSAVMFAGMVSLSSSKTYDYQVRIEARFDAIGPGRFKNVAWAY